MSMNGYLRLIEESLIPSLRDLDDDQMARFLFPEDGETDSSVDIEKSWHAIHFLLCGDLEPNDSTESMALLGGSEVGPDLGYGPLRFLSSKEVREVADALEQIDSAEFVSRFDPQKLETAEVYPMGWNDSEDLAVWLRENYEIVRRTYFEGRRSGNAILLWLA